MNILAIDSACEILSVALAVGNETFYIEIDAGVRHSELLMECADTLCKTAGISPGDLNLAACMKGPGSFTGLRIGYSAAKGIAMALGIPLRAIPTMDCLAYPLLIWPGIALPAIDAKRGCFFAALYRNGKEIAGCMDASPQAIAEKVAVSRLSQDEPVVLTGPGAELLYPRLTAHIPDRLIKVDPDCRKGRARELLEIARDHLPEETNDIDLGPVYIRKSDAEEKSNAQGH
jgi:tRNA threonylcarbamoyladenosine biosynthesis protein TsaB